MHRVFSAFNRRSSVVLFALLVLVLLLAACGGGGSSSMNVQPTQATPQPQNTTVQINLGDSPSDRVMAFSANITSIMLTNNSGSAVSLINSSTPVEIMRLAGTMQPMNVLKIPQGTYTGASITMASMSLTYMDPNTRLIVQKTIAGPITTNIAFNPNMTLGSVAMVLSFDMDVANSLSIDTSGNIVMAPVFKTTMNQVGSGMAADPQHGAMEHLFGSTSGVSGSNFSMSMMQSAQPLSFGTNSGTQFSNISGMGMMSNGSLMMVDATLRPDGSIQAQKVQWFMGGGAMTDGIVATITGSPATQIGMVVQNGAGQGMMSSFLSNNATMTFGSGTVFHMNMDGLNFSNLSFTPMFDASHMFTAQHVRCFGANGMGSGGMGGGGMMGSMTAAECDLAQQGLHGTVSNYSASGSQATFTLTIAADSYFATMTGTNTLIVYQQPDTQLLGLTNVTDGQAVEVRGMIFNDNGTFRMVASRILNP
jgi:hypothetical protein